MFLISSSSRRLIAAAVLLSVLSSVGCADTNRVKINPAVRYQQYEGFGEGGMGQIVPVWYRKYTEAQRNEFLDKLYTLKDNGLGLRICRFLMPVGDAPDHHHMNRYIDQNERCPESFEPEEGQFQWDGHEEVLWRVKGAARRGALMWSSWYSVPYWMTISGCTAGHSDGRKNNLRQDKEERFIKHVCDVLKHFKTEWNIEFDYLSLINEPESDWWKSGGGQPGCHVSSDQAVRLHQYLNKALPEYGFNPKQIAYDSAYTNGHQIQYLDDILESDIEPEIHTLACHQYQTSEKGLHRWRLRAKQYNKKLWMSEWGDWGQSEIGSNNNEHKQAMNYADKIHESFKVLGVNGWVMWEPWFIFNMKDKPFEPRKAYWVIAHYSRHIKPGMQMIKSLESDTDCRTTVWVEDNSNDGTQSIVIVTVNKGKKAVSVHYDFSEFPGVNVKQVRCTDAEKDYQQTAFEQGSIGSFEIDVPAESVTTVSGIIAASEVKGKSNDSKKS